MKTPRSLFAALLLALPHFVPAQSPEVPTHKSTHTVVSAMDTPATPYLAFPGLLDCGPELLVCFKRGVSHMADPGSVLDVVRIDPVSWRVTERRTLAQMEGQIMQSGEWVRFANGDIANYIDAQQQEAPRRIGLRVVRSTDGGKTFGPVERVGAVDGVEYGYAFEAIIRGAATWMLVMTFDNLPGGKGVEGSRPHSGSVDVIRTGDHGQTWRFVRSISGELGGAAINESSFAPQGDGFIIAARGYDKHQWLLTTDGDFKLRRKVDLAAAHGGIKSALGRPRVFAHDGGWYLLTRSFLGPTAPASDAPTPGGNPMRLSLFKFDPETLEITRHVLLDNAEGANVSDGYYAVPYWQKREGRTYFSAITYKRIGDGKPDIIRLEFDWEEVR